ncbi:MAG: hypothetical protein JW878_06135 [Methanomicrobia archaeon]|nr:hypothetical protein [Methanomicrobia archaeon]
MKKKRETLLQDTHALSEVVGFVLIMGILLAVTSIYIAQQVPELTKDYEARHAEEVVDDFSDLDSLVDGIVLVAKLEEVTSGSAATKSITMSPGRVPLFGMSPAGAILSFSPYEEALFTILPYAGGGSLPTGPSANYSMEESTTANFSHANATRVNVDISFDQITLARMGISGDLTLNNMVTTLSGEHQYDTITITNNSIVYLVPGNYLRLYANTILIDATSSVIADGKGYAGGVGGQIGSGAGFGSFGFNGSGGGGAGHGGEGGDGGRGGLSLEKGIATDIGNGGIFYGDNLSTSFEFGSGGGGGGYGEGGQGAPHQGQVGGTGGYGGGVVVLDAALIRIAGNISADGDDGTDGSEAKYASGGGGGGSGGTILIRGYEVNLSSATLSARGGAGGDGGTRTTGSGKNGAGGGRWCRRANKNILR